jgi:putative transposase
MRCWDWAPSSWDKHPTVYRHPLCDRKTLVHVRTPLVSRFSLRRLSGSYRPFGALSHSPGAEFAFELPGFGATHLESSRWLGLSQRRKARIHATRPAVENGFIESFNGRLRDACLNTHLFWSIKDACEKIEAWRVDYNTRQPHSALANLPPAAFAASAMRIPAGN